MGRVEDRALRQGGVEVEKPQGGELFVNRPARGAILSDHESARSERIERAPVADVARVSLYPQRVVGCGDAGAWLRRA